MMKDRTRRLELGKMLLDVAKYVLSIVVIGGMVSDRVQPEAILIGLALGGGLIGIGFQVIPLEEKTIEQL